MAHAPLIGSNRASRPSLAVAVSIAVSALLLASASALSARGGAASTSRAQATTPPGAPAEVEPFATALDACTAATLEAPHPLMRSFTITHTVGGEKDGVCVYEQTMPGKMTMICAFTPEGRKALAEELRRTAKEGRMTGSSKAAPPGWMKECEIAMPSGKRVPAAGARLE